MPSYTEYAQLWLYNNTTDKDQLFADFRDNLSGMNANSNMQKIDTHLKNLNESVKTVKDLPSIITVKAIKGDSPNNYTANNVTEFTSYKNNMLFLLYLDNSNEGLLTLSINDKDPVSVMKVDKEGNLVNLDADDLKKNIGYLCQYDGTQLVVVGEKFESASTSVIVSETEPEEQIIGGIWNQLLTNGGVKQQVKQVDGTYLEIPPQTTAILVSFQDKTTLEDFKKDIQENYVKFVPNDSTEMPPLPIDADTLDGHDSTYFSSVEETDSKIADLSEQISNPNLLDNWYFLDPINQRGETNYSNQGHAIDRWNFSNSTFSISENGITLTANGVKEYYFLQFHENANNFIGNTYTISLLAADNVLYTTSFTVNGSIPSTNKIRILSTIINQKIHLEIWLYADKRILFQFNSIGITQEDTFVAAKLELGSRQTLAHQDENGNWVLNDPPPNKQQELAKCQRYFVRLSATDLGGNTYVDFGMMNAYIVDRGSAPLYLPQPMRTKPTIAITKNSNNMGMLLRKYESGSTPVVEKEFVNIVPSVNVMAGNYIELLFQTSSSNPFGANQSYHVELAENACIDFVTDL